MQRRDRDPEIGVVLRILPLQAAADALDVRGRLRRGHAGFQRPMTSRYQAPRLATRKSSSCSIGTQSARAFRIRESRWRHADDRVRRAFDRHRLANGVAAAPETLQPEAVAEDDHMVMPGSFSSLRNPRPRIGRTRSTSKKPALTSAPSARIGRAAARYRQADVVDRGHARQRAILRAHVEEVRARHHRQRTARHLMEHADELLRIVRREAA